MNLRSYLKRSLVVALCGAAFVACDSQSTAAVSSQVVDAPLSSPQLDSLVDKVYNSLSAQERLAQLHSVRAKLITVDGKLSRELCEKYIPHGVGHIAQYACTQDLTPNEMRDFVRDLQEYVMSCTDARIPAICHEELITGVAAKGATIYPQQIGVACSWNPALVELKSQYSAESLRAIGGQLALSPMVDVVRTQHFNRGEESYGEDSYLSSAMAVAFVEGLQGEDLVQGVAATTKHFLGYGGGSALPEKELMEEVLMPHEVAIRVAGSKSLMPGYHTFEGETAVTNRYFIEDILHRYLHFDGIVVSDYFAISTKGMAKKLGKTLEQHLKDRCEAAFNNGADMELCDFEAFQYIPELIREGKIKESDFEFAVKQNLRMKGRLGLLDENPVLYEEGDVDLNKPEYERLAYEMAAQSVVLLKNNGVLPLDPTKRRVALVGPNAYSCWAMFGDYTYPAHHTFFQGHVVDTTFPKTYTLKEGLERSVAEGVEVVYERGCDWDPTLKTAIEKGGDARIEPSKMDNLIKMLRDGAPATSWSGAMAAAKSSDVVIAAMGENLALCGEGRNRAGIRLPGEQERFVEELIDAGRPVVVVIFGGRAMLLSDKILNGAAAIVEAWYAGQQGGCAVADILTGKVNPSGKLATSYPKSSKRVELCYNYGAEKMSPYVEFPFGYGLSYTTFEYSDLKINRGSIDLGCGEEVEVSFTLRNSGSRDGAEVAQLYISPAAESAHFKPIQLKGFERVELKAGESRCVTFRFDPRIISYFEKGGENLGVWRVTAGDFVVKIGASSSDIKLSDKISLTGESRVTPLREIYFSSVSVE